MSLVKHSDGLPQTLFMQLPNCDYHPFSFLVKKIMKAQCEFLDFHFPESCLYIFFEILSKVPSCLTKAVSVVSSF